jgi:hypothetical protein
VCPDRRENFRDAKIVTSASASFFYAAEREAGPLHAAAPTRPGGDVMRTFPTPNIPIHHTADSTHAGAYFDRDALVRSAATILGTVFLAIGVAGFYAPGLLGTHLSPAHNVIHLVSGAASLYFGLLGTSAGASLFCTCFGIVYGALAAAGFLLGAPEQTMAAMAHGVDPHLLRVIPGTLELGTHDHLLHAGIAALYLAAGVLGLPAPSRREAQSPDEDRRRTNAPMPPIPPLL